MIAAYSGVTISINVVPNFDQLSKDQAENVLYNTVVPACESRHVLLSQYGNHNGMNSLVGVEKYNAEKKTHKLFNVKRVQTVFAQLNTILLPASKYALGSYGLKHVVEEIQKEYLTNGDLIAAMLLSGYSARFGKRNESMGVNCEFKAKLQSQHGM